MDLCDLPKIVPTCLMPIETDRLKRPDDGQPPAADLGALWLAASSQLFP